MTAWGWVAPKGRRSLTVYASSAPSGQGFFDDPVHGLRSRLRRALHPWLQASAPSGRCGRDARYLPETLLAWFVDCPEGASDCSHGWSGDSRGTRGCRFGDLSPRRGEGNSRCMLPLPLRGRGTLTILSTGCACGFAARFTRGYRPAPLRGATGETPAIRYGPSGRGGRDSRDPVRPLGRCGRDSRFRNDSRGAAGGTCALNGLSRTLWSSAARTAGLRRPPWGFRRFRSRP